MQVLFIILVAVCWTIGVSAIIHGDCRPGFEKYEGICYHFSWANKTVNSAMEAVPYCNRLHSRLASIEGEDEHTFVAKKVQEKDSNYYWIGAYELDYKNPDPIPKDKRKFYWLSTGTEMRINHWCGPNPDNFNDVQWCMEFDKLPSPGVNDNKCRNDDFPVLCKYEWLYKRADC